MRGRGVVLLLILVMTAVSLGVAGIAMHMLYDAAFAGQRARLVETAQSQARLIEAIARHEVNHSRDAHPESPQAATLSQIVYAHKRYEGFGETGEFTLARREGDQIVFLLGHRHYDLYNSRPIPFDSEWGEPMRRALSGMSGTVIGLDYRGVEVLAAYEPVEEFDWGIVAKIDLAEVRAPFVRAGIITGCAGLAMVLVGSVLFFRIGTPVVQRLEESEKRFRSMAEATSDRIWEVDRDGVYTYASPKVRDLLGYEPEEVIGKTPFDFMPGDEARRVARLFKEALEAQAPLVAVENTNLHKDGHPVVLETSSVPILGRDGKLLGYRGIDRDITERKEAEEALRDSEERYRRIVETTNEGIWVIDVENKTVFANRRMAEMLGYATDEMSGKSFFDFMDEEWKGTARNNVKRRQAGITEQHDFMFRRRDGSELWTIVSTNPIFDEHNNFIGALGMITDITERKRAEEALRTAYQEKAAVLDGMSELVVYQDMEHRILWANRAVGESVGSAPEELVGRYCYDVLAQRSEPCEGCPVVRAHDTGQTQEGEMSIRAGRAFFVRAHPICNTEGQPVSVVEVIDDITDRKRAEQAVRAAQERLVEQQRSETQRVEAELDKARDQLVRQTRLATIGQISASIAHDLRNPLGTVRNATYYLRRRLTGGEPQIGEYLDIIDQETTAADSIIANLMSMIRSGEPAKHAVDLGRIVQEVLDRAGLPEGVRCRTSLDPDPFTVRADAGQLRQVITNLVRNAVQALDGRGEILVTASRSLDHDTIVLQDDGPGIPPELHERVFEPLFTTRTKGTGLGLTICRQIIERHGGTIEVVDHTGRGASFRIRLPR